MNPLGVSSKDSLLRLKTFVAWLVAVALLAQPLPIRAQSASQPPSGDGNTASPIKHVIVIIGENRSFDHVFATYQPKNGEHVDNLLSKGIVKPDGTPGPNYALSTQYNAMTMGAFSISPQSKSPYAKIPPPAAGGNQEPSDARPAPFKTLDTAVKAEPDLLPAYTRDLLTGATGLAPNTPDVRVPNVFNLNSGVFQLTPGVKYDDYAASPVHRFYQMWQQADCDAKRATKPNPSGCLNDLFPWVETTIGAGSNGQPPPPNFGPLTTGEGSTAMAFYNVQQGDAPYLKALADEYTLSDNFHQSVMGGTGVNHIVFGFADAIWYSDGNGHPAVPPDNQIENPNPQPGTNNYYDDDGYVGGSYTNCSDLSQPGVAAIVSYLGSLPRPVKPNCEPGYYYLLNNFYPGFTGTGHVISPSLTPFAIPPTSVRHIGDPLMEKNISFKYYGEHWTRYQMDPGETDPYDKYCNICNPFQYASDIMTNPALREAHIQDTDQLYEDIAKSTLPAVSIVKPSGFSDGHPASSKLDLFEGFTEKIIRAVQANPALWKDTAIFVTFDEGGGYYDSGYIQPVDYFGDGTRIPLIVVSPYSSGGHVVHAYYDHVSIIKFIERNWSLKPLTSRSRDNLPNPLTARENPYVPLNTPAIGDCFEMFDFAHPEFGVKP